MLGSVAVTSSPAIMENSVFRQSLSRSVLQGNSGNSCGGVARCLFGPPEPKVSMDLVRESELKSALAFGKRFNFDIISGEPFPSAKKMKLSHESCDDSDEENANVDRTLDEEEAHDNEGYNWTETYTEEYMAKCNKHAINTSIMGPSRLAAVSLLFAPIILHSNHAFSSLTPAKSTTTSTIPPQESPVTLTSTSESSPSDVSSPASPLDLASSPETNNNTVTSKKSHSISAVEKRNNRINSHLSHHYPKSAKKSSLSKAQNVLNRVIKHAVMKKPQKAIITDYMSVRRMKADSQQSGKKQ